MREHIAVANQRQLRGRRQLPQQLPVGRLLVAGVMTDSANKQQCHTQASMLSLRPCTGMPREAPQPSSPLLHGAAVHDDGGGARLLQQRHHARRVHLPLALTCTTAPAPGEDDALCCLLCKRGT